MVPMTNDSGRKSGVRSTKGRRPHPLGTASQDDFSPLTIAVSRQPNFTAVSKDNTPSTGTLSIRDQFMSTDRFEAQVRLSKRPVHTVERSSYKEVMADLCCPDFFLITDWWNDAQMYCDWHSWHPELTDFYRRYRDYCRDVQAIPIMISGGFAEYGLAIAHCHYWTNLSADHWAVLDRIGYEIAGKTMTHHPTLPGVWVRSKWRPQSESTWRPRWI